MFLATDALVLALRALTFVALFQAAGLAIYLGSNDTAAFGGSLERLRNMARVAALIALCAAVAHYVLTPARMAGSFGSTFDPSLESLLVRSSSGTAHIARVVGLAVLFLALDRGTLLNRRVSLAAAALALASFALMGHTSIHPWRVVLAPLLLVHVGVGAWWLGALSAFYVMTSRESAAVTASLLARFSAQAIRLVPALFVCGVLMGIAFIGSVADLATGYGGLVIGKVAAFAVLMWLAALNRGRFVPRLAAGDGSAVNTLRSTVRAEWLVIAAVLIATAVMTSLFSPEHLEGHFAPGHEETEH